MMTSTIAESPAVSAVSATDKPTASPRGERRRVATDRKLMKATLQVAVERGISGVTIEEVARRSGVAKTTIYRRYRNANELIRGIRAMYVADGDMIEPLSPTKEHFTQMLRCIVDWVADNDIDVDSVGIVLSSDAEFFRHIVDQVITPWLSRLHDFLESGMAQGLFRRGLDERLLLSTILGSLVAVEAIENRSATADSSWPERLTELLWPALLA
ncbi:AcrR family transcriptional regulator [Bifidobacterium sp. DSM 109959]|uniref:AcrR family transcriptional regulator n=2 Tax=Bifidobacterium olomucense TaxID=2675324 RepID=A0A7Y0HXA8_9BIFI|nr:TetR/AcrR family transcriptional regulator [Bifidobacterium sp. DSM 109959]NMM98523.1 AcrR family transcriptional regulator [Bifidobacterium sp. DSM 109959]